MSWIDGHLHLWDPERLDYPWLESVPALHRAFGPGQIDFGRHQISGAVFVEAGGRPDQNLAEVAWVETLAESRPGLLGIVAHAQLEDPAGRDEMIASLAERPLVVGVRRNLQDEASGFALSDEFVNGVRTLADHDLSFDVCVRRQQLPEVVDLVERVPEVTFVLDHLGKPPVASGDRAPWRDILHRLAAHPNIVCKLSGLTTEADHATWKEADVLPYLRDALALFGPERCLFASDWPVATLATTYERWVDTVETAIADLTIAEQESVKAGTARRVYRLS